MRAGRGATGNDHGSRTPLPLVGRGRGWGLSLISIAPENPTPTRVNARRPSPQGGGLMPHDPMPQPSAIANEARRPPLPPGISRIIFQGMPRPFPPSPIARISVRPDHDDPNAVVGRGRAGSRPAAHRRHVRGGAPPDRGEHADLRRRSRPAPASSHASICRWTRDGGWKRPPFAPRANDTVPAPRASAQLQAPHARRAPRRARRAPHPRTGGERVRRSRQARRGAGASEDGEARRPAARPQAAGRRSAEPRGSPPPDHAALRRPASTSPARRARRSRISSPTANGRRRRPCRRAAAARAARGSSGG